MAITLANYQATLSWDASEFKKGISDANTQFSNFSSKLGKFSSGVVAGLSTAVGAASTALIGFAKSSVDAGSQFDASMSQVAATMGVTVDQITDLRDFAQEMGAKTAFSATQAADALNFMALAGYDAETSMQMLPNVLNLAAAGAMELADASDVVTDVQSALGLTLEETTELVDKMAMTASKSNTSVAQLGEAYLTLGGTGKMLAGGTTELSTALGILADNGVKGAEGGTALRNMILSLAAPTDNAALAMESLGLQVYDAAGNMRPLNEIFGDLNGVLSTMTQGEQTQVLNEIFNKVDLKSVNALLANTGDRFDELSGYIDDAAGSAEQMANTQLDNLTGDVTLLKSAFEGLQISVSDNLTGSLRDAVNFGSEQLGILTDAVREGCLTGLAGAVGEVLTNVITKISGSVPQILNLGTQIIQSFLTGINNSAGQIASIAGDIITTLVTGIIGLLPTLIETAVTLVSSFATTLAGQIPTLLPVIVQGLIDAAQALIDNLPVLLDAVIAIINGLVEGIVESIPIIIEALPQIIDSIITFLLDAIPQIIDAGIQLFTAIIGALPDIITAIVEAIPQIVNGLIDAIIGSIPQIIDSGVKLLISLIQDLPTIIKVVCEAIPQIVTSLVNAIVSNIDKIILAGVQLFTSLVDNLPTIIKEIVKAVPQIITSLVNAFTNSMSTIKNIGVNIVKGLFNGISDSVTWLYNKLKGWVSDVWGYIKKLFGIGSPSKISAEYGNFIVQGLGVGIEENADAANKATKKLADNVISQFDELADHVTDIENGISDNEINKTVTVTPIAGDSEINAITSGFDITADKMVDGFDGALVRFTDRLSGLLPGMVSGITMGTTAGIKPSNGSQVVINMGNISVSGCLDKDASEQVRAIAEEQVQDFSDALAEVFV